MVKDYVITARSAVLSPCRAYRYELRRVFDKGSGTVLFVLNNPSTADAQEDDPALRRGMQYAHDWGYKELIFANVNPCRSTCPKIAKTAKLPESVITGNLTRLGALAQCADKVVAAWGSDARRDLAASAENVLRCETDLQALAFTAAFQPKHILYLSKALKPQLWRSKHE